MLDFHSHFSTDYSVLNTDLLLPQNYCEENEKKVLSGCSWHIGEIGLDSRYTEIIRIEDQVEIFRKLLLYAKKMDFAVSVHSVRCTKLTIDTIKDAGLRPWKVLWHGFQGSAETAAQLYKSGVIISLGPRFRGNFREIIKANPMFAIETDYEGNDYNEHSLIFSELCNKVCEETCLSINQLEEHCNEVEKAFKN